MKHNEMIFPKLKTMRDSNPITGEVWVVDENNHCVASFRIKTRESHLKGSTENTMNAGLNLDCANNLINHLYSVWDVERCCGQPD